VALTTVKHMANENPTPAEEPAPDPFEAELVAYLDGELDPAAARKVEARLAKDPAARARAAELKKSFDMLDYLPKPEPSTTFTSRTLEKLPAIKTTPATSAPTPPTNPRPGSKSRPVPTAASASTSLPVPLELDEPALSAPPPPPTWTPARLAAICAAVALCAVVGYFAAAVARSYVFRDRDPVDGKGEAEQRVIENLPLYAAADDLQFVFELTKLEYFGEDPAVAYDRGLKIPHSEGVEKTGSKHFDSLQKSFRALPSARRAEIIKLDHDLFALDARERDVCFRALEAYAVWLERLKDPERRAVLEAATPALRLGVIRSVRDNLWLDALPLGLKGKPELIQQWRDEEAVRRERLAFVRKHAEAFAANKSPWPFDTEAGRHGVLEFARDVLKVDDPKRCRLSAEELGEYRRILHVAQRDAAWAWYGLLVYELAQLHPYLPEPADAKLMHTDVDGLPEQITIRFGKAKIVPPRIKAVVGKWPEFPLQVHDTMFVAKFGFLPQLGPKNLEELKPVVRTFAEKELFPKMTGGEKFDLAKHQGRWPEYSQRLLHYAHKYDLPVPGVTLPGSPRKWDSTYGTRPVAPK
jgi:hypothetical protein